MTKRGFVYVLDHEHMPDLIKVGCTERSPHERAAELSNHTGVPGPFRVLCYLEVDEFQAVEKALHKWLDSYRIDAGREFFGGCLDEAVRFLYWHPRRLAFCDCTEPADGPSALVYELLGCSLWNLPDPWNPPPSPEPAPEPAPEPVPEPVPEPGLRLVSNGVGAE